MKRNPSLFYLATMFFIVLAMLVALTGCNAEQIRTLETEQVRLRAEAADAEARIAALNDAVRIAKAIGDEERAKVLEAARIVEEEEAAKLERRKQRNLDALLLAKEPGRAIQDGSEAVAPLLPPPFNLLLPIVTAAIFGETARRRGNRKVQRVGETLEMSGAVKFKHPQQGMQAAGQMGSHINAHLSIGRDKAKARIAEVVAARGPVEKISFGPSDTK